MKTSTTVLSIVASVLFPFANAQEGYPMDGTWRGEWGEAGGEKTMIVMVLGWNGIELAGTINPGRNAIPVQSAVLSPESWTFQLAANAQDGTQIAIDGSLGNIGAYNRDVVGTWKMNGESFPFRMVRE